MQVFWILFKHDDIINVYIYTLFPDVLDYSRAVSRLLGQLRPGLREKVPSNALNAVNPQWFVRAKMSFTCNVQSNRGKLTCVCRGLAGP